MSAFPTGNLHRDGAIVAVLRELISNGEPTYQAAATLCNRYGPTFDGLSSAEYSEALAMMQRIEAVGNDDEQVAADDATSYSKADHCEVEPEMTQERLRVAINEETNALALDRQALQRGLIEQKKAADVLAQKLYAWQTGGEKVDALANTKSWIASNQARKQALHDGTLCEPVRGGRRMRSVVDRTAYGLGGGADDFVRSSPPVASLNGRVVPYGTPGSLPGTKGFRRGSTTRRVPSER